jgi:hypothetical protein
MYFCGMKTPNLPIIMGITALFSLICTISSCVSGEQCVLCTPDMTETVTKATLQFVPTNNPNDTIFATLNDLNYVEVFSGTGETALLQNNTQYQVYLDLWNEQKTIPEHVSTKLLNEGTYHQCFYTIPDSLWLDLQYADADSNNNPIGLKMIAQTGNPSHDTLGIIMSLEITGKDNNPDTGEKEIDIKFPIIIE